ncbi:hypothetical protein LZC95_45825 [Pendulispora brunnea]|uniref:Uncharacterized protein n=1 Tax=Pendulispora brunnea TaxID=2905690 RepID=A0ABZ2K4Y6_9BACT
MNPTGYRRLIALQLLSVPAMMALSFHTGCSAQSQDEVATVSAEGRTLREGVLACDPTAPFGQPSVVSIGPHRDGGTRTIPGDKTSARLTLDETTIYIDTQYQNESSKGAWDLVTGQRSSNTTFAQATWLQGLNSPQADRWPSISDDNLTLVFASDRNQPGTSRIFLSKRSSTSAPFGLPQEISGLPPGSLDSPYLRGNELWFQAPNGNGDIYRAPLTNGTAGQVTPVTEFNTSDSEISPVLSADGLVAFFGSSQSISDGGTDAGPPRFRIWTASRKSTSDRFPLPTLVAELMSSADQWPTWLSSDGCRLYFVSARGGAQLVYVAAR